jgi:hypothetical protein
MGIAPGAAMKTLGARGAKQRPPTSLAPPPPPPSRDRGPPRARPKEEAGSARGSRESGEREGERPRPPATAQVRHDQRRTQSGHPPAARPLPHPPPPPPAPRNKAGSRAAARRPPAGPRHAPYSSQNIFPLPASASRCPKTQPS